jgi:uncharacterized protein YggE
MKNIGMFVLMVLLAVSIGLGILGVVTPKGQYLTTADMRNTLSVSGNAKTTVEPDTASMSIGVQTEAKTAAEAQRSNAGKMTAVKSAILAAGINEADLETGYFYTDPVYTGQYVCPDDMLNCTRDEKVWEYTLTGYKTTHTLNVKTKALDKVGGVLDAAVDAGANKVDSISFTLDEAKEKEIKQQLLVQAATDAKKQAETLATASGVKVAGVMSITQTSYYPPSPYYYRMAEDAVGAAAPSTEITPGNVDVSVSVSAVYEIQ